MLGHHLETFNPNSQYILNASSNTQLVNRTARLYSFKFLLQPNVQIDTLYVSKYFEAKMKMISLYIITLNRLV